MLTTFAPQPHTEAAALLRGKPVLARKAFDQLLPELRGRAFTIAGVESANVQQRVRDTIATTAEGETWPEARDKIIAELQPFLGDGAERRAELLLRTHGFQAFQATNWRVAQADDDTTHLQYLTMEDERVRPGHAALEGVILPKDDPFWQTHFPPWEWGCRCRTRPMNPDLVAEAKQADESRAPDDKLVMEGPALTKLNEGVILRNGRATSVLPPEGENAFHWHPDNLRIPLADLEKRYDADVWKAFETFAKDQDIEPDTTLWDWLKGSASPSPAPPSAQPVTAEPVQIAALKASMKEQGFKRPSMDALNVIPPQVATHLANLNIQAESRESARYNRHAHTIYIRRNAKHWSGHPQTILHEIGHHLHYETGIVDNLHTDPGFQAAMAKDLEHWKKWIMERHGDAWQGIYSPRNPLPIVNDISKAMGLEGYDVNVDMNAAQQAGRIADTIMGLTGGRYGAGHKVAYMQVHGSKEVFTHAFTALMDGEPLFKKLFPNVLEFVAQTLRV